MKLATVFFLFFAFCARAEKVARNSTDVERLDNRGPKSTSRASGRTRSLTRELNLTTRLGLAGGVTTLSTTGSQDTTTTRTLYLGGTAEINFHFLGADVEGYYGNGGVDFNNTSGSRLLQPQTGSLSQYGVLGNVHGQIPIDIGRVRIMPKAGLGYGLMSLTMSGDVSVLNSANTVDAGRTQTVNGLYFMGGIVVDPVDFLEVSVDYSQSLTASADVTGAVSRLSVALPNRDGSFNRLRLGVLFRLTDHLLLGAQYIQRVIDVNQGISIGGLDPKQQHFVGNLRFEF